MSAADGVILFLALLAVVAAVVYWLRHRHDCSGCGSCPHSNTCRHKPPEEE